MSKLGGWLGSSSTVDNWLGNSSGIAQASRAVDAWKRIQDKPASIVFVRGATALAAQTVRVEYDNTASYEEANEDAGRSAIRSVTVFGIRNHATLADTNIAVSDRFSFDSQVFKVVHILYSLGEIQARCEVIS